ncbi:MAG: ABC transporter ATP-binding protein/permease [Lachnospiraceae bacterium]|nr:ABC transporter ATP-binding protein/permease [Lachnospiraceae bacterium]
MIEKLQHKYALSKDGAIGLVKACAACTVSYIVLMLPAGLLYQLIGDLLSGEMRSERIVMYSVGSVLILACIAITQRIQYQSTFFSTYVESGIRRKNLAERLRKLPLSYFAKKNLTDLTTNLLADCTQIETASSHWIPELIGGVISVIIMGVSMFFFFDYRLVLASFWVIPAAFFIVYTSSGKQKKAVKKTIEKQLVMQDGIQECLESVRDLRSNGAMDAYLQGLYEKIENVEKETMRTELTMAIYVSGAQMLLKIGIGTTALVGGILFAGGEIDILTLFFFFMVVSRLYDPMNVSLQNFSAIIGTEIQCERLDEVLSHPMQEGEDTLSNKDYDITFEHVKFSYAKDATVLEDVSFVAKQGQVTALIGPSGGGKTTVSRLASRFWDVDEGTIKVGGMDISKIDPEKLLSMYSIVFQDVTLFNNTVMENIRIGKKDATDEEVLRAAKLANCQVFVDHLPQGYQTMIGENGSELSGGERQRISIARAFLKDAPIILLDEATASLDVENETLIQESLSKLIQNKTVLIIAHRMRTVEEADKIVVLKDGEVKEAGSPKELSEKKDGIFKHMREVQLKSADWKMA